MKPQRPRTERRRKQREVAKRLERELKAMAQFIMKPTPQSQANEQGETHGQEED